MVTSRPLVSVGDRPSRLRRLVAQLRSPMVGLLGLAAALSAALGDALDASAILVVVIVNAILGFVPEARADRATAALRELLRPRAAVLRDGRLHDVDARELVPGDVVVLDAGDRVPADGRIDHARSLELDESMMTGESLPVAREHGELLAGTTVTRGVARMVITATGPRTRLGRIAEAATRPRRATPLEERLAHLAGTLLRASGRSVCLILALVTLGEGTPAWRAGRNPWLLAAVASSALLAALVLAVPTLTQAFDLRAIGAGSLVVALSLAVVPLAVGATIKARRATRSTRAGRPLR